ncbi:MAG: DUF4230 domain-containing protein [Bacteroidetes bacterium]|nr:DUF4230 domain-containing protein [Bacteroidota bacterium]
MLQIRHSVLFACILLQLACKQKQDPVTRVLQVRDMSALATTEYSITKIVKASDDKTWYKFGDRKILMSVEADVRAGIDLAQLKKEDVIINGKSIQLNLPAPKIMSVNLPPEKIKVEYEDIGPLRDPFDNAARDALLAQAEKQIRSAMDQTAILADTEKNTRNLLSNFLQQAGYEQIEIRFGNTKQTLQ